MPASRPSQDRRATMEDLPLRSSEREPLRTVRLTRVVARRIPDRLRTPLLFAAAPFVLLEALVRTALRLRVAPGHR